VSDSRAWWKDAEDMESKQREQQAAQGLNVTGYAGKWRVAQELAIKNERTDDARLLPYWERVRLLFLELGGAYTNEHLQS
jgi:hypothetical protein